MLNRTISFLCGGKTQVIAFTAEIKYCFKDKKLQIEIGKL